MTAPEYAQPYFLKAAICVAPGATTPKAKANSRNICFFETNASAAAAVQGKKAPPISAAFKARASFAESK